MLGRSVAVFAIVNAFACARAQTSGPPAWGPLDKLLGSWVADSGSGGRPGAAIRGGETWARDLDGRVLVRHDFSEYPASTSRPAFRHDGLMVIAPAAAGFEAYSFDNEGHVITYGVVAGDTAVVLTSLLATGQPQFRLTYRPTSSGYAVGFEIATPDRPGVFRPYVTGGLHHAP
ncbi:MAG: hypothetical protein ACHQWU_15220 [Gemmatimonadales bacterium]